MSCENICQIFCNMTSLCKLAKFFFRNLDGWGSQDWRGIVHKWRHTLFCFFHKGGGGSGGRRQDLSWNQIDNLTNYYTTKSIWGGGLKISNFAWRHFSPYLIIVERWNWRMNWSKLEEKLFVSRTFNKKSFFLDSILGA